MKEKPGSEPTMQHYDAVVHYTSRAVLIEEDGEKFWIPRSQIEEEYTDEDLQDMKESKEAGEFTIPEWLHDGKTPAD